MYELGLVTRFEAAHRLKGNFGPATRLHGHTYRVEITIGGRNLKDDGTLLDLGLLQQSVARVIDPLHYQDLDEVPLIKGQNTTVEFMARHIAGELASHLIGHNLTSLVVRLWESDQVFAACEVSLQ